MSGYVCIRIIANIARLFKDRAVLYKGDGDWSGFLTNCFMRVEPSHPKYGR